MRVRISRPRWRRSRCSFACGLNGCYSRATNRRPTAKGCQVSTWIAAVLLALLVLVWLDLFVLYRRGRIVPSRIPRYEIIKDHWLPVLLGAGATALGRRVLLKRGVVPSAIGLAHEYYHAVNTIWWRYAWSRIVGSRYWQDEERGAHEYAKTHWQLFETDAWVVADALT